MLSLDIQTINDTTLMCTQQGNCICNMCQKTLSASNFRMRHKLVLHILQTQDPEFYESIKNEFIYNYISHPLIKHIFVNSFNVIHYVKNNSSLNAKCFFSDFVQPSK